MMAPSPPTKPPTKLTPHSSPPLQKSQTFKHRAQKRKCSERKGQQLKSFKRRYGPQIGTSWNAREARLHPEPFRAMLSTSGHIAQDAYSAVPSQHLRKSSSLGPLEKIWLQRLYSNQSRETKKLKLVLDLDHTLMNSTNLSDLAADESHVLGHISVKKEEGLLHRLDFLDCPMLVKLRPFVREFLREAKKMFDLYVYTMGTRDYAIEVVKLLDPENKYFPSKVISRSDCTRMGQKALDIVPGSRACTIILDDNLSVWKEEDREHLIEMQRYNFFASSFQGFYWAGKSLAQLRIDEREADGTLACIMSVLKHAYDKFLRTEQKIPKASANFQIILKELRSEILRGCVVAFTGVPPNCLGWRPFWQVAEQLGAKCCRDVDASVTHILAMHSGSIDFVRWALQSGKYLVHVDWLETARYLWLRPREVDFLMLPTA